MDDLTAEEMRFLRAALKAAPNDADHFYHDDLGRRLRMATQQSLDISSALKARDYIRRAPVPPAEARPNLYPLSLTRKGRLAGRELHHRRRAKVWEWGFKGGVALLAAAFGIVTDQLKKRLDAVEEKQKQQQATPAPASQPTTPER